jgi:formylglycine-generating enzyme required for sulfatase activity
MKNILLFAICLFSKFLFAQTEVIIPAGEFQMGDHYGFVDSTHPSDEIPVHLVKVDSFYMTTTDITNQQFLVFLDSAFAGGLIVVQNNMVYRVGDTNVLCYTNQYAAYYSIGYNGIGFSIVDSRANHPMVGVRWFGAIAYCNWLSSQHGLQQCYNLATGDCDFTKNGYRLPTEAEWEYAGRGGQYNPYYIYPWGNDLDTTKANWPNSGDPYETGPYPLTTPVAFYDGTLKQKTDYNWPGSASIYQTSNGVNGFGLYDMAGNVWEFVNDWYGRDYYASSPYDNPKGPDTGTLMPDGKPYRGMRGGSWYNGEIIDSVNNGHSRVSNRDPSYYRGPQDPNNPWYHVGFRAARYFTGITSGEGYIPVNKSSLRISPNPFSEATNVSFTLQETSVIVLKVYNSSGQVVLTLINEKLNEGAHTVEWDPGNSPGGVYICQLQCGSHVVNEKVVLIK